MTERWASDTIDTMMGRTLAIATALALGSAACMLVLSPGELDSAWSTSTSDASAEASPEGGEPPNLSKNGDFELGCDVSWIGYHASVSDDSVARSGKKSCRVCYVSGSADTQFGIKPVLNSVSSIRGTMVQPNVKYRLEAWVRSTDDASAPASAFVLMSFGDQGYNPILGGIAKEAPLPTATWTVYRTDVLATDPGVASLTPEIGSLQGADGVCILVDDVKVSVVP